LTISIDNFSLYLALAGVGVSCVAYLLLAVGGERVNRTALPRLARIAYYSSAACLAYASVYLLQQILSNQRYDIAYIHDYSSPTDALIYRISAFWAGQQGSMLLWALLGAVIGVALISKLGHIAPVLAGFWCSIQTFICVLLIAADPFAKLVGYKPGMFGAGLNPLLKNPWMAIHPPVVFIGYAVLAVPAAFAVAALVKGDANRWARMCLPWALFGWVSLSAGIILGMVWSYEVLGWGGYWGWDPVENSSLVPWLVSTALVHGLLLQRSRSRMARSNLVMAFATFLSIIYATFLTRSGVLADFSVHSFADLGAYKPLLAFLLFYAVLSVGLLIGRWRAVATRTSPLRADSRDFAMVVGVIVIVLLALVVLAGTSWPLIAKAGVQPTFYNHMSTPVAVLIAVLMALAPVLSWSREGSAKQSGPSALLRIIAGAALLSAASGVLALAAPGVAKSLFGWLVPPGSRLFGVAVPLVMMLSLSCVFALVANVRKGAASSLRRSGAYIAHAGAALLLLGIVFSSTGDSETLTLTRDGRSLPACGWEIAYKGRASTGEGKEVLRLLATRPGREIPIRLKMEYTERGSVRSPHIASTLLRDLYVSPVDTQGTTITPGATVAGSEWIASPARIEGTGALVSLVGMQVEQRSARFEYKPKDGRPVEFETGEGRPAVVDGYTFTYRKVVISENHDDSAISAGVVLDVVGGGLKDRVTVEVSTKPLMSLLWLGTVLIVLGGVIAVLRRRSEGARGEDGILPDSD